MKILSTSLSISIALSLLAPALQAATLTWNGGGANANFDNADNWAGSQAPVYTDANNYIFTGSQNTTPVLTSTSNGPIAVSITFDENAGSFNLSPSTFSTASNRFRWKSDALNTITQNSANNQTISATISQSGYIVAALGMLP